MLVLNYNNSEQKSACCGVLSTDAGGRRKKSGEKGSLLLCRLRFNKLDTKGPTADNTDTEEPASLKERGSTEEAKLRPAEKD